VRFTLNYDINMNEKTESTVNSAAFKKWSKDFDNNQWTFRMQVKF
jgi:hypothetical protein